VVYCLRNNFCGTVTNPTNIRKMFNFMGFMISFVLNMQQNSQKIVNFQNLELLNKI
jgi:hypothetical protein